MIRGDTIAASLIKTAAIVVSVYSLYCLTVFFTQRHMIYPGTMLSHDAGGPHPQGARTVWFSAGDDRVEAWFLPSGNPRGAVIFAHGNYELIDRNADDLRPYRDMGLHVLLIEYPGYGRSAGSPSQRSIVGLFACGYDWLIRDKGVNPDTIVFHGRSLGGGVVCALSRERKAAGLVLESTFISAAELAGKYLVPPFILMDSYDNRSMLRDYKGPVLLFHGTEDGIIPYRHGLALKEAAKDVKFMSATCGHNDYPHDERFWNTVRFFLEEKVFGRVK